MAEPVVAENPQEHRFEITVDGELAGFSVYEQQGRDYALVHTEIDDRFGGRGLGSTLVSSTLTQLRDRGIGVLPFCPFVGRWLVHHPEFADVVPAGRRADFGL